MDVILYVLYTLIASIYDILIDIQWVEIKPLMLVTVGHYIGSPETVLTSHRVGDPPC